MEGVRLYDIDFSAQEILQIHLQGAEVQQGATGLELDEEIDIAVGTSFASGDGAEDAQASHSTALSQLQNRLALSLEEKKTNCGRAHLPPPGEITMS